jgi:hypothetical protein
VKQWSLNNNNNKQSLQQQNGVEKLAAAAAEDASARERARAGGADKEPLRRLLRPQEFVCAFEKRWDLQRRL